MRVVCASLVVAVLFAMKVRAFFFVLIVPIGIIVKKGLEKILGCEHIKCFRV